ncbi:histone-lysine N-methyltransferase, H3 lysine-79 specific-like [Ostrinia nubilalis]|uniref:histone-lysine N-methyltransferase, H3 lysine-79 specific-like n=1 Tax=Ostrinia nubilalis TaxID=29057 RepID=UPI0030824D32
MLKAGEYSPNNPLLARERAPGDALLGLGEYERRRHTLRRIRQQQYREYLDQQAKKKQEAKEQAERERREREEKEREREEREREREREERERERQERESRQEIERERQERDRARRIAERRSPERRRASDNYTGHVATFSYNNRVDTGVQVDSVSAPLSVAVQTDDSELFRLPSPCKSQLTQAERELSPHTVAPERPPAAWAPRGGAERRRSLGDFDERSSTLLKKSNRDKLTSDLRHSYMPSIFDADAIQMRNLQAEKEAAARRQFYQQELKNQIMEQQRIREERKSREKMLEQAEMRRLEEQLRMLRVAQDREMDKRHHIDTAIQENKMEYDKKRKELQKDIDNEQLKLLRAPLSTSQLTSLPKRITTSKSDTDTKLPSYFRSNYPRIEREEERQIRPLEKTELPHEINFRLTANEPTQERVYQNKEHSRYSEKSEPYERKPYSMNIPDDSIFSPNYDVDSYLRKNLNFKDRFDFNRYDYDDIGKVAETEKVLVHERPKSKNVPIAKERKSIQDPIDSLPIPVLRHSPVIQSDRVETGSNLSEAMRKVDDKWKVPVVQKNILKSVPNEEGKNVSILTQLGSIRRQLQLEQLKLDMISKDDDV